MELGARPCYEGCRGLVAELQGRADVEVGRQAASDSDGGNGSGSGSGVAGRAAVSVYAQAKAVMPEPVRHYDLNDDER